MIVKGFRIHFPRQKGHRKGISYRPKYEGCLFLAPTKGAAMAWLIELGLRSKKGKTAPLYYVEVEAKGKVEKGKWSSILPQIIIYEPYKVRRFEKIKEISIWEAEKKFNGRFYAFQKRETLRREKEAA